MAHPALNIQPVIDWLVEGARPSRLPQDVLMDTCRRTVAAGLPLYRVGVFVRTLHPNVLGRAFIWQADKAAVEMSEAAHDLLDSEVFLKSPIRVVFTENVEVRRRLAETAEKEQWNGATLIGPHRDDIVFASAERDLAGFASRGQQRTAILAFKLAQLDLLRATLGQAPLLLLDDVFSELDPGRRAHLVRRIGELPQAFVTTTTTDDLDPQLVAAATVWQVSPGSLERAA